MSLSLRPVRSLKPLRVLSQLLSAGPSTLLNQRLLPSPGPNLLPSASLLLGESLRSRCRA